MKPALEEIEILLHPKEPFDLLSGQTDSRGSVNKVQFQIIQRKESLRNQKVNEKGGMGCPKAQRLSHYYEGYPDAPRVNKAITAMSWMFGMVAVPLVVGIAIIAFLAAFVSL